MLPDQGLEASDMKRMHMNHIQDIIRRLQMGESERRISRDKHISRQTVHKYHEIAKEQGYLEKGRAQPSEAELQEALGPGVQAPKQVSTVESYREAIQDWMKQGVEMTAIWLRLKENYGYKGGIPRSGGLCTGLNPESRKHISGCIVHRARICRLILGQLGSCTIR